MSQEYQGESMITDIERALEMLNIGKTAKASAILGEIEYKIRVATNIGSHSLSLSGQSS